MSKGSAERRAMRLAEERGRRVGGILLHAANKQATVNDLATRLQAATNATAHETLRYEKMRQEDKLAGRKHSAECLILAAVGLLLTEVKDPRVSHEGILTAIDLDQATLQLTQEDGEALEVVFATSLPIPDGLEQTYYGHELNFDFVVNSVAAGYEWAVR